MVGFCRTALLKTTHIRCGNSRWRWMRCGRWWSVLLMHSATQQRIHSHYMWPHTGMHITMCPSVWRCCYCCNCHYEENEDVGCSCQLYLIFVFVVVVVVIFQFFKRCHNHFLLPVMMMWRLKLYCGLVWLMWYNYLSIRIWLKPWSSRQHTDCRLRDKYAPREACN